MASLKTIHIFVFIICVFGDISEQNLGNIHSNYTMCNNTIKDPFFKDKTVVGKPWRVYFTWNMDLDVFCLEFTFKFANKTKVNSLKLDVESLKIQPPYDKDVLVISVTASPDMLMFEDVSGVPGLFVGMICDIQGNPDKKQKTHRMALKLLNKGQYLLMTDCSFGTTSLSVRRENRPKRAEIEAVAANLTFGDPYPACTGERDKLI